MLFSLVAAAPAAAACASCLANISLPSGSITTAVANDGVNATFAVTLSGIGSGYFIGNGVYRGWCGDNYTAPALSRPTTLYSTYSTSLPASAANANWPRVNYVLNHKQGVPLDVQQAIWALLTSYTPTTAPAIAMYNDAMANGAAFVPESGGVVAILLFINGFDYRAQDLLIEAPVPAWGRIGDYIWQDKNQNGIQEAGEVGIDNVTVRLKDSSGATLATTATSYDGVSHGYYQFKDLPHGSYLVEVDETTLPANLIPTLTGQGNPAVDSNGNPAAVTLATDTSSDQTIDFGYISSCRATIGNFVWNDLDGDGIQDAGEPGLPHVRLTLTGAAGPSTTTTDATGLYQFTGLCAGTYTVEVDATTLPENFGPTASLAGSDRSVDSNGSPTTATLETNEASDQTLDFGYISLCEGSIGNFVWHDLSRDGVQDAGEPGLNGVSIQLLNASGTMVASTTTAASPDGSYNGYYQFTGLCAGAYTVKALENTLPSGYSPAPTGQGGAAADSNVNPAAVTLATNASDQTIDFGYLSPCTGAIGDFVWNDANRNGIQDAGETGIDNATLYLRKPEDNTLLATTTTLSGGAYKFGGLCGGSYIVEVVPPAGMTASPALAGGDRAADSNVSGETVTLPGHESEDKTIDFGFSVPCSGKIGDRVWDDANRNGVQDAGEAGIADVSLALFQQGDSSPIATAATGADGKYLFTGLCAGTYEVAVTAPPADMEASPVLQGGNQAADSNPTPSTVVLTEDNSQDLTVDFGYNTPCAGSIGDFVWLDKNHNDVQDAGEPGIAGVALTLGPSGAIAVTDGAGRYEFVGLCAGSYTVTVSAPAGMTAVTPLQGGDVTLDSNGSPAPVTLLTDNATDTSIDFGFETPCTGAIGDFVWNDLNHNGVQDAGEPGISGVGLTLTPGGKTTATDAAGHYLFSGLCAGSYSVAVTAPPAGLTPTTAMVGSSATDSNGSPATTTLAADTTQDLTLDFGYTAPLSTLAVTCPAAGGEVGAPYSSGVAATGGLAPYTFEIIGVLPAGLTLNPATGAITGTPTAAGMFGFAVKVTDAMGATALSACTQNCSANIVRWYFSIPTGVLGESVEYTSGGLKVTASGYTNSGAPAALFGHSQSGAAGLGVSGTEGDQIDALNYVQADVGAAIAAGAISAQISVSGLETGETFNVYGSNAAGAVGALLLADQTAGVLDIPDFANYRYISVRATTGGVLLQSVTFGFRCGIVVSAPVTLKCGTCGENKGYVGSEFEATLTATGGVAPYTYSIVSGALPGGLTLDGASGTISGTPTTAGTFNFTTKVVDATGATIATATVKCGIVILNSPVELKCGTCGSGKAYVGKAFSEQLVAWGGTGPYTYSIESGALPPGLTLDPATGKISGTPIATGTYTFSAKAVDATGKVDYASCTIVVLALPLDIQCGACGENKAYVGTPYSKELKVSGGVGPYTFSITGSLPPGLTFDAATGVISGTPTKTGSYAFSAKVVDSTGKSDTTSCSIYVAGSPINLTCSACGGGTGKVGTPYSATMGVSGGKAPYTFSIVSGALPPGLTLAASTGKITGTPTAAGTYTFTVKVVDSKGNTDTADCTIVVKGSAVNLGCGACSSGKGQVGVAYSAAFTVTGGTPSYTYSIVSGALPSGLTLDSKTGKIAGTPNKAGTFAFTAKVKDSRGNSDTVECTIVVLGSSLDLRCGDCGSNYGKVGEPFSESLSVKGGVGSYKFSIVSGSLPPGVTLNATTGKISGTPTEGGTFAFTAKVVDSKGNTDTSSCTIVIAAAPLNLECGACGAGKAYAGVEYSAKLAVSGGTGPYTFSIISGSLPKGLTLASSTGTIAGTPAVTGTYTFKAKVVDQKGKSDTVQCTIVVTGSPVELTCGVCGSSSAKVGVAFTSTLSAKGGSSPYTFSVVEGSLPTGLSLNGSTGKVSGTPSKAGAFTFKVKVVDKNGLSDTATCTITVKKGH